MKYVKPLALFSNLLKTKASQRGRLLGLNVGDKYVGLAISDPSNKLADPLSVLPRTKTKMNIDLMATDFQRLISEFSVVGFVIGYPFDRLKGGRDAIGVKVFVDELYETGKLVDVNYTYADECFTSEHTEFFLKPLNLHPVRAKTIINKFAAVSILQGYLDYANRESKVESAEQTEALHGSKMKSS